MTTAGEWQNRVGRSWADNFRLTDRAFSGLTDRLLARLATVDASSVLDIGCGAGELSLAIARQRPGAAVVGVDVSPHLIAAANARGAMIGNARFALADAALWDADGFAPELLTSRHGVMFFDEPAAAFANLHRLTATGGQLVFSCFRALAENPWASEAAALLGVGPNADPQAPGPFAFADPDHVAAVLMDGGWSDSQFEEVNFAYVAGQGDDPVADGLEFFRQIGPAARALGTLEGDDKARAETWLRDWLEDHRSGDIVAFSAAAWIVTAQH